MKVIRKAEGTLEKLLPPVRPLEGVVYVPSQFVVTLTYNGGEYAYNTLTKEFLETEMPRRCRAGEGYDGLIRRLFLVPEGKDERAFYLSVSALLRAYGQRKGTKGFTILPTLACNARCVYCYEEGMKPVSMTGETVEQTVRYILAQRSEGRIALNWFGGEPLLRPDVIDRVCGKLKEAGVPYRSVMISNGSLITPEIIARMKDGWHMEAIQISMDGAESDYIARKRYMNGKNYYRQVIESIDQISAAGIRVSVRCNVDEENFAGVPGLIEDLKARVTHKSKVKLYLAPLYGARTGDNALDLWDKVLSARALIEAAGFSSASTADRKSKLQVNYCMADGSGVVIGPDGSLYPCEHCPPESRFGDIWHGVTDENARKEFCRADRVREKCRDCPFLPQCTAFASCPVQDCHCRELRMKLKMASLRRMIDKAGDNGADEEADIIC